MEDSHQSTPPLESRDTALIQMPLSSSSIAAEDHTTDSTQSPVHKVLETPELVEKILEYLPYTHTASPLELCRRVNKFFCNTIDHSLFLQRKLFLKSNGRYNGSMEEGCESGFLYYKREMHCSFHELHPLLQHRPFERNPKSDFTVCFFLYNITEPGYIVNHPVQFNLHRFTQTLENVSGLCDDSSVHKMFLTNPPIKVVEISTSVDWANPCVEEYVTESYEESIEKMMSAKYPQARFPRGDILTSDEGITFGQLFEYTKEQVTGVQKADIRPYQEPPFSGGGWSEDWETESEWSNDVEEDDETSLI